MKKKKKKGQKKKKTSCIYKCKLPFLKLNKQTKPLNPNFYMVIHGCVLLY